MFIQVFFKWIFILNLTVQSLIVCTYLFIKIINILEDNWHSKSWRGRIAAKM